jgi:UDP-N-acetylglucosamine 4,6-dehydratase
MKYLDNKVLLITGGTGSFGSAATKILLKTKIKKLIVFSRDENKQYEMQNEIKDKRLRFFIGDIRDEERLIMAFRGVDYIIHAAAQKHVPSSEYNPFESIKTNVFGTQAIISASIKTNVKKVIALSTDKACNPINLYGATKLCAEKLFINGNQLSGKNRTKFSVVRYGNVIASRGSVIPFFKNLSKDSKNTIPLTHSEMTRFFITLDSAIKFVLKSFEEMNSGEIFIPKMFSIYIKDLIKILCPKNKIKIIGMRPGEKIHETLFSTEESNNIVEKKDSFIIYPYQKIFKKNNFKKIKNFTYTSGSKKNIDYKKIKKLIDGKF